MKPLLAFAAGVALTSLAFVLLGNSATTPPTGLEDGAGTPSSSVLGPVRDISPSGQTTTAAEVGAAAQSSGVVSNGPDIPDDLARLAMRSDRSWDMTIDLLRDWSDEDLRTVEERAQAIASRSQEVQAAEKVAGVVGEELLRRERIESWADEPPPDQPIVLSPEFSRLLENANIRRDHERIQREPMDPTWSLPMETNLQDFISAQSDLLGQYGSPTINCRTSACEITFVAYGIDTTASAAEQGNPNVPPDIALQTDFLYSASQLSEEPWVADQLRPNGISRISVDDGITTVIWHLYRVQDSGQWPDLAGHGQPARGRSRFLERQDRPPDESLEGIAIPVSPFASELETDDDCHVTAAAGGAAGA